MHTKTSSVLLFQNLFHYMHHLLYIRGSEVSREVGEGFNFGNTKSEFKAYKEKTQNLEALNEYYLFKQLPTQFRCDCSTRVVDCSVSQLLRH